MISSVEVARRWKVLDDMHCDSGNLSAGEKIQGIGLCKSVIVQGLGRSALSQLGRLAWMKRRESRASTTTRNAIEWVTITICGRSE